MPANPVYAGRIRLRGSGTLPATASTGSSGSSAARSSSKTGCEPSSNVGRGKALVSPEAMLRRSSPQRWASARVAVGHGRQHRVPLGPDVGGHEVGQHHAQRVDVAGRTEPLVGAEAGEVAVALGVDEDVGGVEVAVHDAALVHVVEDVGELGAELGDGGGRDADVLDPGVERLAVDEAHDEIGPDGLEVRVVDGDETGVGQAAEDACLGGEARERLVGGEVVEELEGHGSLEPDVVGGVHRGGAP
jgi:hypothetical protein